MGALIMQNPGMNADAANIKSIRLAVFFLFFASGISGLVYEVVWSRHLTYLFGATLFAVATVLSAFMGGMALGSWIFGKVADKSRRNLRNFALLQIGIGLSALILPLLLKSCHPIYRLAYRSFDASFGVLSLMRFALSFLVLLVPTTLMGATLPVLSRFMVRNRNTLGLNVGALYSVNTFGAVLGCFLAGFILIARFGIHNTTLIAVAINLAVGIISLAISRNLPPESGENEAGETSPKPQPADSPLPEDPSQSRRIVKAVLLSYGISGFIALSYQVVWNRALVFTFEAMKNTTYSFTAMLTVFLVGLAAGGAVMSSRIDRQKDPLRLFALIQALIGLSGALSFYIIFFVGPEFAPFSLYDAAGQVRWSAGVLNVFAKTAIAILLPTFLMGMAFPVVTRICVQRISAVGFGVGRIYSVNTLGSIFGAFVCGFILIPLLGVAGTLYILATGNLLIALYIFHVNPGLSPRLRTHLRVACAVIAAVLLIRAPRHVRFQELSPTEEMVFYKEGPLATVSVIENSFKYRTLYVDNVGVAGTDRILLTDQKSLAHVPMLLLKDPKSALTVGFGSGGASFSYTTYNSAEEIHCVEICDTVMDTAPDLLASNHGLLLPMNRKAPMPRPVKDYVAQAYPGYLTFDPRYRIILDDVRSYLNFTGRKYDIIATDCTDLRYKSNANLYDLSYFELCRDHITEDGMVVVWMPLAGLSDEMFRVALRTFYRVFPEMSVWYMNNESTHYILLIGTPQPLRIDYALLERKLREDDVRHDLAELFLDDPVKLLSCYICDQTTLDAFLSGENINTEDRPFLEFESPKYGYGEQPMIENLNSLISLRTPIMPYLDNAPDTAEFRDLMDRFYRAIPYIVQGHAEYRALNLVRSCRHYMEAMRICPEDRATRYLLDYDELKLRIAARPTDAWGYRELGAVFFEQGRHADAVTWLSGLLKQALPPDESASEETLNYYNASILYANKTIARSYIAAGRPKAARPFLDKARELSPLDEELSEIESLIPSE